VLIAAWNWTSTPSGTVRLRYASEDRHAKRLEGDAVWVGPAAHAGVEGVDLGKFRRSEFEIEDIEVLGDRCGRTDFGIAERPCWMCQRSITCAADLP